MPDPECLARVSNKQGLDDTGIRTIFFHGGGGGGGRGKGEGGRREGGGKGEGEGEGEVRRGKERERGRCEGDGGGGSGALSSVLGYMIRSFRIRSLCNAVPRVQFFSVGGEGEGEGGTMSGKII